MAELRDDLLTGAEAIAAYIGWRPARVYYLASKGALPVNHVGALLVARKSELDSALSGARKPGL